MSDYDFDDFVAELERQEQALMEKEQSRIRKQQSKQNAAEESVKKEEQIFQQLIEQQRQKDLNLRQEIEAELKKEDEMRRQLDESKWQKEEQQRLVEEEIRRRLEDKEKEVKRKKKELEERKKKHELEKKKAELKLVKLRAEKERLEKEEKEKRDFQKSLLSTNTPSISHNSNKDEQNENEENEEINHEQEEEEKHEQLSQKRTTSFSRLQSKPRRLSYTSILEKVDLSSGLIVNTSAASKLGQKKHDNTNTNTNATTATSKNQLKQSVGSEVLGLDPAHQQLIDEFDLLGGGDIEEPSQTAMLGNLIPTGKNNSNNNRASRGMNGDYNNSDAGSIGSHSVTRETHRDKPARGSLDEAVDLALDSIPYSIPIQKSGKLDGRYLFGMRVISIQQERETGELFVQKLTLEQFISKNTRAEEMRMRGMEAFRSIPTGLLPV